jgi:hypothetical protein
VNPGRPADGVARSSSGTLEASSSSPPRRADALGRRDWNAPDPAPPAAWQRQLLSARNVATVATHRTAARLRRTPPRPESGLGYPKVFVVGCGRSGTSWVQDLLSGSSKVATNQESHIYEQIYTPLVTRGHSVRTWARVLHRYDMDERRQRWVGLYWWVTRRQLVDLIDGVVARPDLSPDAAARQVIEGILDTWYRNHARSGQVLLEKTPGHLGHGQVILDHFPEATMIEVVRDGRDVCVSLEKQAITLDWPPTSREAQIQMWKRNVERGEQLKSSPRFAPRVHRVHYEDLLADTETELARLFDVVNIDATPDEVSRIVEGNDISRHTGRGDGRHRRKGVSGEWRDELSSDDIALFDRLAGDTARAAGYDDRGRCR